MHCTTNLVQDFFSRPSKPKKPELPLARRLSIETEEHVDEGDSAESEAQSRPPPVLTPEERASIEARIRSLEEKQRESVRTPIPSTSAGLTRSKLRRRREEALAECRDLTPKEESLRYVVRIIRFLMYCNAFARANRNRLTRSLFSWSLNHG